MKKLNDDTLKYQHIFEPLMTTFLAGFFFNRIILYYLSYFIFNFFLETWNLRFKKVIELTQKPTVTKGYTCNHIKFSYPQVQCPFSHTYFIIPHQMSTSFEDLFQQCLTRNWNNATWVLFEIMPFFFFKVEQRQPWKCWLTWYSGPREGKRRIWDYSETEYDRPT